MKVIIIFFLFFHALSSPAVAQAYKYHTVEPEENVFRIAQKYGISTEDIYKYNPDARNGVNVGSKLVIPLQQETNSSSENKPGQRMATTFRDHKVQRQETLYGLAGQYEVSEDDIKRYNKELYSRELQYGETIRIPVFAKQQVSESKPGSETKPAAQPSLSGRLSGTREHIILPKETKYGIARKYGMTVKELEELNPTVDVLQPGIMLKVGTNVLDEPVIITDDAFQFYEVQPQETLFSLTRRFQVDQDSLIALNPALKDGLKWGMVLKVPTKDSRGRDLPDVEVVPGEEFEKTEADLTTKLKDFSTKNLVLMLPFNLSKVNNDSISNSRQVLLNDGVMRISLDFYSGVLMALETAKEMGISTNLKVYDTQQQPGTVSSIISRNNFSNVHAVIGPLFQATSEEAATRLSNLRVPVISPISNRELRSMPNLYQARPSDENLREAMIDYLKNNSQGKNIIIVADGSNGGIKNKLISALPNARLVNPGGNNVSEGSISPSLMRDRENWVILESESVALLGSATSALYRLARNNRIRLFTTNKNSSYDSDVIVNEHLGRLHFTYPSEYKEFDETISDKFIDDYKSKYGVVPNKYTVRGYDLTLDVLLRLGAMSSLEQSVQENIVTEYVENKFIYLPKINGGFSNNAVYILQLNDDLTIRAAN